MLRIRALRPDKLAGSLNSIKRLSTAPGSGKPPSSGASKTSTTAAPTAGKSTASPTVQAAYQPKTPPIQTESGFPWITTTLLSLIFVATGVSYKLEADKSWRDYAQQKHPFILELSAPIRAVVQYSGLVREEGAKKKEDKAAARKEVIAKRDEARETAKAERAAYRDAYLNVVSKEEDEAKKAANAASAVAAHVAEQNSVNVAEAVQSVKNAEKELTSAVENAAAHLSSEISSQTGAVPTPEQLATAVEESLHHHEEEQAKNFSAHDEVHDLEVKYHLTSEGTAESAATDGATDSAASETESDSSEETAAAAAASQVASAVAAKVQPSMNELNQTTLHYELQTQARKILSELQEELHHSKIRELIVQHQQELATALKQQAEELETRRKHDLEKQERQITRALQDDLNHQVAVLRQAQVEEMMAMQPRIEGIKAQLKTYEVIADETAAAVQETLRSNELASAILALEYALSIPTGQRTSVAGHFDNIKLAADGDALVTGVLNSLPKSVIQNGALHTSELHLRFNIMKEEVRKVALAPEEAPKMVGQLIGTVLAALTWAPKGYVSGHGVEDVLARTEYYLERGYVREALNELKQIKGYARVLMKDFESLAEDRLLVDQSIAVLKAKSVLKHKALVP